MDFLVVDGCPCPAGIAPFVKLVLDRAGQSASSIYRGEDPAAARILHAHGKHTQAEIHRLMPAISNPAGLSQHELRSDGVGNPRVPRGEDLRPWQQGVDSGDDSAQSKREIVEAAAHYGWKVRHPYNSAVEGHHWCFTVMPKPNKRAPKALIERTRKALPRR